VTGFSALTLALGALALAGCGSSSTNGRSTTASTATQTTTASSGPSSTPTSTTGATSTTQKLALAAASSGELKYSTKLLTANAGKVSIAFTNMSPLEHNMTIENAAHQIVGRTPTFTGGSKTLSLSLKPGVYKFFCSVPGHRQAGMEGELVVK
jgi:plastocyanin